MKYPNMKTALHLGIFGAVVAVIAVSGGVRPAPAQAMDLATLCDRSSAIGPAEPAQAGIIQTRLNGDTTLANVRRGPGPEFEIMGTVSNQATIEVIGRAKDSYWLQIEWQGQTGWLAGDLIADQDLLPTLPTVESAAVVAVTTPQPVNTDGWLCLGQIVRGFGTAWDNHPEIRPLLGCPFTDFRQGEHATKAAVQTFAQGWMLWLETDSVANVDPIYVFFADDGSYLRFGDQPLADSHKYAPTPYGFSKVGDRFAKVYWELLSLEDRTRLGLATNEAKDSSGAFQEFVNGRMFWAGEADTIYVIYQGYYDFDYDGEVIWRQGWKSYEDTFEAPADE
jgi:hypothetical protein